MIKYIPPSGSPFYLFQQQTQQQRQFTKWETPRDDWNISSVPRSIVPHLKPRNGTVPQVPPPRPINQSDEELLAQLKELKVSTYTTTIAI